MREGLPLASACLRYTVGAELSHNATAALGAIIQFLASCSPLTHCTPLCATGFCGVCGIWGVMGCICCWRICMRLSGIGGA